MVFPARAGMSLTCQTPETTVESFPRPRGDEPRLPVLPLPFPEFSPPARG